MFSTSRPRARTQAVRIAALALVASLTAACGSTNESTATTTSSPEHGSLSTTVEAGPSGGHDHGDEMIEVSGTIPTIEIEVLEDPKSGYNLHVATTDFTLAPQNVSTNPVDGEGHMHLYVDGEKVTRLYGNWYYLGELDPGEHEVRVELSANNHTPLAQNGNKIEDTVTITVPEPESGDEQATGEVGADKTIEVHVMDGNVMGGVETVTVRTGETVAITIHSDSGDDVHLHGYDKLVPVAAGGEASLIFEANIPGQFEVEMEGSGLKILEVKVD